MSEPSDTFGGLYNLAKKAKYAWNHHDPTAQEINKLKSDSEAKAKKYYYDHPEEHNEVIPTNELGGDRISTPLNRFGVDESKRGFVLPYHNYIGPGNTLDRGDPIDVDDAIAQQHDLAYSKAKTPEEIREADRIAIEAFDDDFKKTGNWHSKVGSFGLGAKHSIEGIIGVKYPSLQVCQ